MSGCMFVSKATPPTRTHSLNAFKNLGSETCSATSVDRTAWAALAVAVGGLEGMKVLGWPGRLREGDGVCGGIGLDLWWVFWEEGAEGAGEEEVDRVG